MRSIRHCIPKRVSSFAAEFSEAMHGRHRFISFFFSRRGFFFSSLSWKEATMTPAHQSELSNRRLDRWRSKIGISANWLFSVSTTTFHLPRCFVSSSSGSVGGGRAFCTESVRRSHHRQTLRADALTIGRKMTLIFSSPPPTTYTSSHTLCFLSSLPTPF